METTSNLTISSSAQIHHKDSTARIMWAVVICLLPAGIWGVIGFGVKALLTIFVSILFSVGTEALLSKISGKLTILDGSAFLTGLLIGYNLPPAVPIYIPAVASIFAIVVVKWTFGGLGGNWMNPALAGRVFVFFSWTSPMTKWTFPSFMSAADTVSGASPLGFTKAGLLTTSESFSGPLDFLNQFGYPVSNFDTNATDWFNSLFHSDIHYGYFDSFFGLIPGSIGEVSAFLLIIGAIYLFVKKIITWEIPVIYLGTFGLLVYIFGGKMYGNGFFSGDVVYHILTGGLMLGALYMATDMVTSPLMKKGRIIYAAGLGFLTFLIRFYGSFPEGVSLAIILMNIFVPFIDRFSKTKRFGIIATKKEDA